MPTHADYFPSGAPVLRNPPMYYFDFTVSDIALASLRPRDPNYITPPAEVDESAPAVDLGGADPKLSTSGYVLGYAGPKLTAKEKRAHPVSYGAKLYPMSHESIGLPRKAKNSAEAYNAMQDSSATFRGWADVLAEREAKRVKAQAEYDATHPQPVEA